MKRVLNSGYITLLLVDGSEETTLQQFGAGWPPFPTQNDLIAELFKSNPHTLRHVTFKFQIKAPFALLNTFQKTNKGHFEVFDHLDVAEAYLPPFFYKLDPLDGHLQLDSKACNDLNTKYSNFYRNVINFYNKLLDQGVCESQAKLVLPTGLFTTFYWIVTAKDLLEFIEKNYYVSPEMYGYCSTFVLYLEENMPQITKWLKKNTWSEFEQI